MKKIITIIALSLLIISCGKSKEETAIENYVQQIGNTTVDLNVKFIEIKDLEPYTNKDSIQEIDKLIQYDALSMKNKAKRSIIEYSEKLGTTKAKLEYAPNKKLKDAYSKSIASYQELIAFDKKTIDKVDSQNYKGLTKNINSLLDVKSELSKNTDKAIYNKKEVKYSIKNPLLNNAVQTKKEVFYLTKDNSKVVRSENSK